MYPQTYVSNLFARLNLTHTWRVRVKIFKECEGGIGDQVKHCDRQNEKTDRAVPAESCILRNGRCISRRKEERSNRQRGEQALSVRAATPTVGNLFRPGIESELASE